jgi:DNA-binding NtrC family response regulator
MSNNLGKVMIVDDEPDILFILGAVLRKWNIPHEAFSDPLKALESFETAPQNYRMLLTDNRMPEMTGLELTSKILKIRNDMPVVLMTAFEVSANDLATQLPAIKREQILQKPFDMKRIHECLIKLLV